MKPVLLLMSGMLNDSRVWAGVAQRLQPLAEVRCFDPVGQSSVPEMAEAAWRCLQDVPPGVPLVLAGFSLGGYVAMEMLAHPRRAIDAAALVSTSARPDTAEGVARREETIRAMQKDFAGVVEGILKWATHSPTEQLREELRRMMLSIGAAAGIRQSRAVIARSDHRAALALLSLPVLVMCGRQDRITPPALSEELAGLMPKARLQLQDAAGHLLPCEQAAAVAESIQTLLKGSA